MLFHEVDERETDLGKLGDPEFDRSGHAQEASNLASVDVRGP